MVQVKIFSCGICNKYSGTRKGLRNHLKIEHFITKNLTNVASLDHKRQLIPSQTTKQTWWQTQIIE